MKYGDGEVSIFNIFIAWSFALLRSLQSMIPFLAGAALFQQAQMSIAPESLWWLNVELYVLISASVIGFFTIDEALSQGTRFISLHDMLQIVPAGFVFAFASPLIPWGIAVATPFVALGVWFAYIVRSSRKNLEALTLQQS